MEARVRKDAPSMSASVGVHTDVEIKLVMPRDDGEGAEIHFGPDGQLVLDFSDVDSMDRLVVAAVQGALQLRAQRAMLYPGRAAVGFPSGFTIVSADPAGTAESPDELPSCDPAAGNADAAAWLRALTAVADLGPSRMRDDGDRAAELVDR